MSFGGKPELDIPASDSRNQLQIDGQKILLTRS